MTAQPARMRQLDDGWLLSRDLRDQPRLRAARLAQHHIAAHRTWGVSAGLAVDQVRGRLEVGPGYAVDRCGRIGILPRPFRVRLADAGLQNREFAVVLAVVGDGPLACVRMRDPSRLDEADVPLAVVDAQGVVRSGDEERRWLRAPGPARTFGGVVPRGAPLVAGPPHATRAAWTVHVDLSEHRLDAAPAVVASPAGTPSGSPPSVALALAGAQMTVPIVATTLEVADVTSDGFDVTVRHHLAIPSGTLGANGAARAGAEIRTAPMPVAWTALLTADRPSVPFVEESS